MSKTRRRSIPLLLRNLGEGERSKRTSTQPKCPDLGSTYPGSTGGPTCASCTRSFSTSAALLNASKRTKRRWWPASFQDRGHMAWLTTRERARASPGSRANVSRSRAKRRRPDRVQGPTTIRRAAGATALHPSWAAVEVWPSAVWRRDVASAIPRRARSQGPALTTMGSRKRRVSAVETLAGSLDGCSHPAASSGPRCPRISWWRSTRRMVKLVHLPERTAPGCSEIWAQCSAWRRRARASAREQSGCNPKLHPPLGRALAGTR
mmetsp:Transcript_23689/g.38551  ORF Transcript_23689/g.38551 Transcript_23689/m.38551 type:complete len:264 (-) Transcript_23689:330-1121(-)